MEKEEHDAGAVNNDLAGSAESQRPGVLFKYNLYGQVWGRSYVSLSNGLRCSEHDFKSVSARLICFFFSVRCSTLGYNIGLGSFRSNG